MENDNQHGDSEMSNLLNALCLLGDLKIQCEALLSVITNDRAKYYLLYGIGRRLSIIMENLEYFYQSVSPIRQAPLDKTSLATVHINSLYVNLCGTIDNIGWVLAYEFNFYPNTVDIEESKERNEINLFHNKFLLKISRINSTFNEYRDYIITKTEWHKELLKSRHPSTHRIPLYIIPSVLNKLESEKYIHHQEQHLEEALKLNIETADEHFNQMNSLGTFIPLFAHDPDIAPSPIYPTIITDCENLIEIVSNFLTCVGHSFKQK